MRVQDFVTAIGADFFTGVPDSLLRPLCDYLYDTHGISESHVIAANEGNSVGLAAGYYMATGKIPVVYMQNSGIGNAVNPIASLLDKRVYGIPCVFIVGWRGEPGKPDEPQHVFQGEISQTLLEDMGIQTHILDKDSTPETVAALMAAFRGAGNGESIAFLVRKGALAYDGGKEAVSLPFPMLREEIIRHVAAAAGEDIIVSTTGKASRELYEIRVQNGQTQGRDFLTVGSMGHCSSIALGLALHRPQNRFWCIDGDGAVLMHMGSLAVTASRGPKNLIHVAINNGAHETVGGMPTVCGGVRLCDVAKACGYPAVFRAENEAELAEALRAAKAAGTLCFVEAMAAQGARADLGRPKTSPGENLRAFRERLG